MEIYIAWLYKTPQIIFQGLHVSLANITGPNGFTLTESLFAYIIISCELFVVIHASGMQAIIVEPPCSNTGKSYIGVFIFRVHIDHIELGIYTLPKIADDFFCKIVGLE